MPFVNFTISSTIAITLAVYTIRAHRRTADKERIAQIAAEKETEYQQRILRFLSSAELEARVEEIVKASTEIKEMFAAEAQTVVLDHLRDSDTILSLDRLIGSVESQLSEVRQLLMFNAVNAKGEPPTLSVKKPDVLK